MQDLSDLKGRPSTQNLPQIRITGNPIQDVSYALNIEWVITNGIGGYASSNILGINTSKYHGLLVTSFKPPLDRWVLLSKFDESLLINDETCLLGSNEFQNGLKPRTPNLPHSFSLSPFPTYEYETLKVDLKKTIFPIHQRNTTVVLYEVTSNHRDRVSLRISPLVNSRHFHGTTNSDEIEWSYIQESDNSKTIIQTTNYQSALILAISSGRYVECEGEWIKGLFFRKDSDQGTSNLDDVYNPGAFTVEISPGESKKFCLAAIGDQDIEVAEKLYSRLERELGDVDCLHQRELRRLGDLLTQFKQIYLRSSTDEWLKWLLIAADSFIVQRASTGTKTIIAGYPWFEDWGRDTLLSLPGLTLITGRYSEAREILLTFKSFCRHGVMPNRFPDETGEEPVYNTVDAALWYFNATLEYLKYTGDFHFVQTELWPTLQSIIKYYTQGTLGNIHLDEDGLISHDPQLTWMDATVNGSPVTGRGGKAVEIQALWYNALKVMELLAIKFGAEPQGTHYAELAEKARCSFNEKFWNNERKCLFDVVVNNSKDNRLRPNQILSISLPFSILDTTKHRDTITTVHQRLWTSYGLRTLPDDDPNYHSKYSGDWSKRNQAYHNGTVWPWLTGPFVTAFLKTKNFEKKWRIFAFKRFLRPLFSDQIKEGGLGSISEILDGDRPHLPRGCISQAWSIAEPLRAYVEDILLHQPKFKSEILRTLGS